ncbi:MAG: acyclic terpene utilization AtuA family protein [Alphaproteobacteria bacterium]
MKSKTVRIGCASGFWGDSAVAAPQLVRGGRLDYLVFDYLAELTMSILARARAKDAGAGYAGDFVTIAMKSVMREIAEQGIRVVSNAGGVNPGACAAALGACAQEAGVALKIACVEGDDLLDRAGDFREQGVTEMFSGAPFPDEPLSVNAYFGAFPIAAALDAGAQIVITGRCVDSALALGPLIHEFGWGPGELDKLAAGSLAGHILECGAQATGGLHTDWARVGDWPNIGYPIAECAADGSFVVGKPEATGGMIAPQVISEQMLYEVGDPGAYLLPDVACDFTQVTMEEAGTDRVRVSGARGNPPPASYKVSATYRDGYRATAMLTIIGREARAKAERTADAILTRVRRIFRAHNIADFSATDIEVLGAEAAYGPHSRALETREVVLKLAVAHPDRAALDIFSREIAPAGTSWAPGTTGFSGRPRAQPKVAMFSFLAAKETAPPRLTVDGQAIPFEPAADGAPSPPMSAATYGDFPPIPDSARIEVPLAALAYARSGDKGDSVNIGLIARRPEFLALIASEVSASRLKAYFAHLVEGGVERFDVPGIGAFNFLLGQALGGGGMASLRNDPLGKGFAQILLDLPVKTPKLWVEEFGLEVV